MSDLLVKCESQYYDFLDECINTRQENILKNSSLTVLREIFVKEICLVIVNKGCPLRRYNRFIIPRCVVNQITLKYPELSEAMYTGFIDVQNDAAHSASTTE